MKKLNKKSILFNISLVVVTAIVLTTALVALDQLNPFKEGIGANSFDIIKTYQEAESRLFFIDQSAKLSSQQIIYDLAANGGFEAESDCGRYKNYNVWSTTDPSIYCYPDNYKELFKKDLNQNLRSYISLLPSGKFTKFSPRFSIYLYNLTPYINYEISFVNNSIIGIPNKDIQLNIYRGEEDLSKPIIGKYIIKPSFNIDFGYNINEYEIIKEQAIDLIRRCQSSQSLSDLRNCINQSLHPLWVLGPCDGTVGDEQERIFRFCVNSNAKALVRNPGTGKIDFEAVTYRFALYFPKP